MMTAKQFFSFSGELGIIADMVASVDRLSEEQIEDFTCRPEQVVTAGGKEYLIITANNILQYCIKTEKYEVCRILKDTINKIERTKD